MKKLIVITAFVLLGTLANSAFAAKDHLVTSPIIPGNTIFCSALNNSDGPVEMKVSFYNPSNGDLSAADTEISDPGTQAGFTLSGELVRSRYCTFEWFGREHDFIFSICGSDGVHFGGTGSISCLNVY